MSAVNHLPRPSAPTPQLFQRLEGRQRVLELQRRRFWRELAFSGAILSADALTIAVVFVVFAQFPLSPGPDTSDFARTLIPPSPEALLRRVSLLLFCLAATRSYTVVNADNHGDRVGLAIVLGIILPRWTELLTTQFVGRAILVALVVAALWLTLLGQRRAILAALQQYDPSRVDQERTLIVGTGPQLRAFVEDHVDPHSTPPAGYEIDSSWPGGQQEGWHTLYEEVFRSRADALILVGPFSDEALQNVLIAGSSAGCRVFGLRRRPFREMNNSTLTRRSDGPIALLSSPALVGWQLVAKRLLDVVGAVSGMILFAPLVVVCALLVKMTSRGPIFFKQPRVGLGGEPFDMLKLRTMVADADARTGELALSNVYQDATLFKVAGDPRITPVGRFLRRSSLDELPQLWNVLRGEMSLVGPRPPLPREVAAYKVRHYVRFEVTPGITGPWQVGGRNDIKDFDEVIRLEQEYISGWTVWRDLILLLRTIPAVLSMRGAL